MLYMSDSQYIKNENDEYRKYSLTGLRCLSFYDAVWVGNTMWVSNNRYNGLYSYNIDTGKSVFHGHFPGEPLDAVGMHMRVTKYGSKLFFFPALSPNISVYDMDSHQFDFFPIIEDKTGFARLANIIVDNEKVYIFPQFLSQPIVVFDMEEQSLEKEYRLASEMKKIGLYFNSQMFADVVMACGKVWLPICEQGILIEYDYMSGHISNLHKIEGKKLKKIAYDGFDFWISDSSIAGVICWNPQKGIIEEFSDIIEFNEKNIAKAANVFIVQNYVWVLPWQGDIIRIDRNEKSICKYNNFPKDFRIIDDFMYDWNATNYYGHTVKNDKIFLYPLTGNMQLEIDIDSEIVEGHQLTCPLKFYWCRIFKESDAFSVDVYLQSIQDKDIDFRKDGNMSIGSRIYKEILNI